MRYLRCMLLGALLAAGFVKSAHAGDSGSPPAPPETSRAAVASIPASTDTSMLTGSGLNTKSWPIDRPVPGGVMRKLPGRRDWIFVRAMPDAEMRQLGQRQEAELLRLHGSEPRDIEIAVLDSLTLRKLARFHIPATCAPPCTLQARVIYRELPKLQRDSLVFWGLGERKVTSQPGSKVPPPAPHPASPRK